MNTPTQVSPFDRGIMSVEPIPCARRRLTRAARDLFLGEGGSSLIELALLSSLFVLILAGSVDLGRACYFAIEVSAAANAGAEYGVQNPTNISGMQKAALLNAPDIRGLTTSASWGCECSDGTSASAACTTKPTCSITTVKYVNVTTTMMYTPTFNYPGLPSSLTLKGSARLRATE